LETFLEIAQDADVVLFVVDASEHLSSVEYDIAQDLRKMGKEVIVVGNKMDLLPEGFNPDLYNLGFNKVQFVSATTGRNSGTYWT